MGRGEWQQKLINFEVDGVKKFGVTRGFLP